MTANLQVAVVCSGNICRSYMAEKVFAARIPRVSWISAGVMPYGPRASADPEAVRALQRRGYQDVDHRCRGISQQLLRSDALLVMEDMNRTMLVELGCDRPGQVRLLTEFDPAGPYEEVANPWGLPAKVYDDVLTLIERCIPGVRRLVKAL